MKRILISILLMVVGLGIFSAEALANTWMSTRGFQVSANPELDDSGRMVRDVTFTALNGSGLSLHINTGTRLLGSDGKPLAGLYCESSKNPPAATSQTVLSAYTLQPNGAQFNPEVTLIMKYDDLPAGVIGSNLLIAWWDGTRWQLLGSLVDTVAKTVTAKVNHFTEFAIVVLPTLTPKPTPTPTATLLAPIPTLTPTPTPKPTPTPSITVTPTPKPTPIPIPTQTPVPTPIPRPVGPNWWLIGGIITALVIILMVVLILFRRER